MALDSTPHIGEALSLLTALVWSSSVILFKKTGESIGPLALNLVKNGIAAVLMIPTMLVLSVPFFPDAPLRHYLIAMLGGLLSIGLADTTFFRSLNMLGAGRHAVVDTMYSPAIILLSLIFLGERLAWGQWIGVVGIVSAVFIATWEPGRAPLERRRLVEGTVWGLVSIVLMAVGLVILKPVLEQEHLFWVTFWRMVGGFLTMLVILPLHPGRRRVFQSLLRRRGWGYLLASSFVGAYFVTMLWLGGMKYTTMSAASALNQTSTVLTFLFAALFLREPITPRKSVAISLAFAGALAVTFLG